MGRTTVGKGGPSRERLPDYSFFTHCGLTTLMNQGEPSTWSVYEIDFPVPIGISMEGKTVLLRVSKELDEQPNYNVMTVSESWKNINCYGPYMIEVKPGVQVKKYDSYPAGTFERNLKLNEWSITSIGGGIARLRFTGKVWGTYVEPVNLRIGFLLRLDMYNH